VNKKQLVENIFAGDSGERMGGDAGFSPTILLLVTKPTKCVMLFV
jgi:hypothetical protein